MKMYKFFTAMMLVFALGSCTSDFDEINRNPNAITNSEASARYFITNVQFTLFTPDRFPYWRAHLIHADRYAGHFTFGHHGSWWSDELGYSYNGGYTNAAWGWMEGYFGTLDNFMKLTAAGGEFENPKMFACAQIIKGLYFQLYSDTYGELPYSDIGKTDVVLPAFNTHKDIYKGIIAELDQAMATIGSSATTGDGVQNLGENDLFFGGDLQKWKKLANTLKLRLAMRARGAAGDDFSANAISQALAAPLLSDFSDNALVKKDNEIVQWTSAAYGDVWHNFGGLGSKWTIGKELIDYLRDNNDPRLAKYAKPAAGGTVTLTKPSGSQASNFAKRVQFILDGLTQAGVPFTQTGTVNDDAVTISMPENAHYVGQPVRLNGNIKDFARYEFFSTPSDIVVQQKNAGQEIFNEVVLSTAESYFLQAEAAVNGLGGGNAESLFQEGIRQSMKLWQVGDAEIDAYLASSDLAKLNGSTEKNFEKIAVQRWIAAYTDGFEAWAIVRDTGYPASLAAGVSDLDLYGLGGINGAYPQRLRYGSSARDKNGSNLDAAIGRQGADNQSTKLWWAK